MRFFDSAAGFSEACAGTAKWDRTLAALEVVGELTPEVTYSVGDSLTYRRTSAERSHGQEFTGRRRYHLVLSPIDDTIEVEFGAQDELTALAAYDDLSDRQGFRGNGQTKSVPAGAVVVFDIDEAARINTRCASELVVLHVTVEGATFHNK